MSTSGGFSSLLDEFKQTTQRAAAAGASGDGTSRRKRPRLADPGRADRDRPRTYRHPATPVRTIYVACPAFAETGGPEALHQLCHAINSGGYPCGDDGGDEGGGGASSPERRDEFGRAVVGGSKSGAGPRTVRARMLYLRERGGGGVEHVRSSRARSAKYDRYDAPPAVEMPGMTSRNDDNEYSSELVIWPECWTHLIDSLQPDDDLDGRKKYQIAIWWLSVNNNKGRFLPAQFAVRKDILHLTQSRYAWEYVSSKLLPKRQGGGPSEGGHNVMMLTEFIPYASPAFAPKLAEPAEPPERDLDVVYNTAKGMHYTDEIIRRACGKAGKADADGSIGGGGLRFNPIGKGSGRAGPADGRGGGGAAAAEQSVHRFRPPPGHGPPPPRGRPGRGAARFDADVPLPGEFKRPSFDADEICALLRRACARSRRGVEEDGAVPRVDIAAGEADGGVRGPTRGSGRTARRVAKGSGDKSGG
ncbi:hypothetical protein ACHAXT_012662 [Thalassiosira profunda]